MSMQIRQYPEVEETVITVTTAYPGASADVIQGFITTPIAKGVEHREHRLRHRDLSARARAPSRCACASAPIPTRR